jgi:phage repressor protein C with HTH and peptisase S24 domain
MVELIGQRLKQAREQAELTQSALAEAAHVDQSTLAHWERGKTKPSPEKVALMAPALGVSEEWLLYGRGRGPLGTGGGNGAAHRVRADVEDVQTSTVFGSVSIDELDTRVGAGAGQLIEGGVKVGHWMMPRELMKLATAAGEDSVKVVSVVGDSMAPTLNPTDRVLVDTSDRLPSPPGIFVVWDGMGLVVKRIEYIPHSDPATIRISSDNARYAPYERSLEEAHIQGRVIGKWQWS